MPVTWFTSDTHFGHRLVAALRGFAPGALLEDGTVDRTVITPGHVRAHDEHIIESWNRHVAPEDTVWHLGDLTLKRAAEVAPILARLNGNLRIVLGNHDRAHPLMGHKAIAETRALYEAGVEYVTPFAEVPVQLPKGRPDPAMRVMLSHFPYHGDHTESPREAQWRLRDEGRVLLHGHTHTAYATMPEHTRQIHVGWDTWRRPVNDREIGHLIIDKGWGQ